MLPPTPVHYCRGQGGLRAPDPLYKKCGIYILKPGNFLFVIPPYILKKMKYFVMVHPIILAKIW